MTAKVTAHGHTYAATLLSIGEVEVYADDDWAARCVWSSVAKVLVLFPTRLPYLTEIQTERVKRALEEELARLHLDRTPRP